MTPRLVAVALASLGACLILLDSAAPLIDRLVIGAACMIGAVIVWSAPNERHDVTNELLHALASAGVEVEYHRHFDGAVISTFDRRTRIAHTITLTDGRIRSVSRSGIGRLDNVRTLAEVIAAVTQPA